MPQRGLALLDDGGGSRVSGAAAVQDCDVVGEVSWRRVALRRSELGMEVEAALLGVRACSLLPALVPAVLAHVLLLLVSGPARGAHGHFRLASHVVGESSLLLSDHEVADVGELELLRPFTVDLHELRPLLPRWRQRSQQCDGLVIRRHLLSNADELVADGLHLVDDVLCALTLLHAQVPQLTEEAALGRHALGLTGGTYLGPRLRRRHALRLSVDEHGSRTRTAR